MMLCSVGVGVRGIFAGGDDGIGGVGFGLCLSRGGDDGTGGVSVGVGLLWWWRWWW